jgi:hypothetical protein
LELLEPLATSVVFHADEVLVVSPPVIDPLQKQTMRLLDVPLDPSIGR